MSTLSHDAAPDALPSDACATEMRQATRRAWVAGLALVALLLRLFRIDAQPVWLDEAASAVNARILTASGLQEMALADHVPPLSFALQALSIGALGAGETALRLPSALVGVAVVPLTYLVAVQLLGPGRAALAAAGFQAVSPFALWYSQEGRMYTMLMACALLLVWLSWPLLTSRVVRPWRWVLIAAVTSLGLWTHDYMVLMSFTLGIYFCVRLGVRSRRLWAWGATQVVAAASFVPWLLMSHAHAQSGSGFGKEGHLAWFPYAYFAFTTGHSLGPSTFELRTLGFAPAIRASLAEVTLAGLTTLGVAALALAILLQRRGPTAWLLMWVTMPVLVAIGATFVLPITFNVRYAVVAFPAFAILAGLVVADAWRSWAPRLVAVLLAVTTLWSLCGWYGDPTYSREDVRSAAPALAAATAPGDDVLIYSSTAILPLGFYGWECSDRDIVVDSEAGAQHVAVALSASDKPGRTLVMAYRTWETDSRGVVLEALRVAGAERVGAWPGVELYRIPHGLAIQPGDGVRRGCP